MKTALIGLTIATVLSPVGQAQDACNALLQQGVYDYFRNQGVQSSTSEIRTQVCSAYSQLQQNQQNGGVSVSYGFFGGSVTLSSSQLQSIAQQMCSSNNSDSAAYSAVQNASAVIDAHAIDAWSACIQMYSRGWVVQTHYGEDGSLTFEASYIPPVGTEAATIVRGIVMSPAAAFSCSGTLLDAVGHTIGTQALGMICTRKVSATSLNVLGRMVYAPEATIQIETDAGNITRYAVALPAPPPPPSALDLALAPVQKQIDDLTKIVGALPSAAVHTSGAGFGLNTPAGATVPLMGANGAITNPRFMGVVVISDGYGRQAVYGVRCDQNPAYQVRLLAGTGAYVVPACTAKGPVLVNQLAAIPNDAPYALVTVIAQNP